MHPILIRIVLPPWQLPLFGVLFFVAVIGALIVALGFRSRATDVVVLGGALTLAGAVSAVLFRGQSYELESLPLNAYGVMLTASLVIGWFLTLRFAERDGLPRATMASFYLIATLSALAAARLLYVLTNSGVFHSFADVLALRRGGLVAYGGFLGGLLGSWIFLRRQRLPLLPWADVAVPALASGLCLTRIGCYLFGCDFGRPLSEHAPRWLARLGTFPRWDEGLVAGVSGSPAWAQHVAAHGLSPDAESSLPVHPTQLYESLAGLVLLGLALLRLPRRSFRGEVFLTCAFAYGLLRFGIEVLRDDAERGVFGPLLAAHVYLPLMLLVFAAAYNYGPARSVAPAVVKRASQVVSLMPALVAWLALRPAPAQRGELVQLSTSQWIALATAIAVAAVWSARPSRGAPESELPNLTGAHRDS